MAWKRSACPLNCPDSCGFLVNYTEEQGLQLKGEKEHPITQGFICSKGQALAELVFSPDRLRFPLRKEKGRFKRISWEEAYTLLTRKIQETLEQTGPLGILHHYDYAHNGALRALDQRFFQALGGMTVPEGSMCWGAGYHAQAIDFGGVYQNDWASLRQSKTIILWGKDPAVTNIHLIPHLLAAKKEEAYLIVINPTQVKSAELAQEYLRINPGTDGILALGLAHIILREGWLDWEFVRNHVHGFEEFALKAKEYEPARVSELTGISEVKMNALARRISHSGPVSFLPGYGLQRYVQGGNTLRAIDALAALTGNIGKPGAGVYYAHQDHQDHLNTVRLPEEHYQVRRFPHPLFAESIEKADPPIQMAVVTRSNPLLQQPNSLLWKEVWSKIPFKVTLELVMSETARQSDLVLPVTTIFEEEDLIVSSWNPMLQVTEKVVEPQGETKSELEIFSELAKRLGIGKKFSLTSSEWIEEIITPLHEYGITLESLHQGPVRAPYIQNVAWEDLNFKTQSGKIELSSDLALKEVGEKVASPRIEQDNENAILSAEYPYYLLTPHPRQAIHSQFQEDEGFHMFIHPELAEKFYLFPGDQALVETRQGQLLARVYVSEDIHPQAVVIPEGNTSNGVGVNQLIKGLSSDLGQSTSYYEVGCQIRKWLVD
ncbi:molybdopterin-containing oxidoreductase family protein [Desulfitobacterium metallireducens]|uniref:Dehydrogenase n=1 Tax=Desulfitobacterium metallireducens DSM 15288 TaxID=871968 RepID=W0EC37_9FIRM|nr:molybdopterin-dependent oxidoreductase [Desulfitobacterium metallireducens]AHF08317.1 dehydrogenase [Desulfitobacterium metallireducens DSM 15288]